MRNPPELLQPLWSPLSDITGWFNWDALSAIGTVGALWFVVVQSTRSGRAERAKSVGILTFLIGLLEPIEVISIYEDTTDADLKRVPRNEIQSDLTIIRKALSGIAELPLPEASSVGVVEWTMCLPLSLRDIEEALKTQTLRPLSSVPSSLRYVQEAVIHFRSERDRLRYGLLVRTAKRLSRKLSLSLAQRRVRVRLLKPKA